MSSANIYISTFFNSIPVFVILTYTPWLAKNLGANDLYVGLLSTIYFLASMLGGFLGGRLSDIMGDRKLLLSAFSCICLPIILILLSMAVSPIQVIALRGFFGLILPVYTLPMLASISEGTGQRGRGGKLGGFNSIISLGSTMGIFWAGYLVSYLSLNSIFQLFAFLSFFSLVPLLLIVNNTDSSTSSREQVKRKTLHSRRTKRLVESESLMYVYLSLTLRTICISGFVSFLPIYVTKELGYSLGFLGIFTGYGIALMIIGMLIAGLIADKRGRLLTMIIGLLFSGLTPIFYSISNSVITLGLGRTLHSFGYCFVLCGVSVFVGDVSDKRKQGSFMGLITLFSGIGGIIGPLIMGIFLGGAGYFKMGIVMSLFAFCALLIIILKVREQ